MGEKGRSLFLSPRRTVCVGFRFTPPNLRFDFFSGGRSLYSIVGSFLIGRGGLSPNPTQAFTINSPLIEWAPPQPELSTEYQSQREYIQDVSNSPLVEATGWTIDEYGKITLVAQAPKATPTVQGLTHPTCR